MEIEKIDAQKDLNRYHHLRFIPQNIQIPEKEHAGRIREEQKTKSKPGKSNRRYAKGKSFKLTNIAKTPSKSKKSKASTKADVQSLKQKGSEQKEGKRTTRRIFDPFIFRLIRASRLRDSKLGRE